MNLLRRPSKADRLAQSYPIPPCSALKSDLKIPKESVMPNFKEDVKMVSFHAPVHPSYYFPENSSNSAFWKI